MISIFKNLLRSREKTWRYRDMSVLYEPSLDGGGRNLSHFFVQLIDERFPRGDRPRFKSAFEWCAGPGFIGFALLAEGICERLCLADINPVAIDYARRTARLNKIEDRVDFFVSDNLKQVPSDKKFDLVVSNPPNYFAINPFHPYFLRLASDLRPNDRNWAIHREFYSTVAGHLLPGAALLIQEISPHKAEVWTPEFDVPYDIRPRPPIDDFQEMIASAGLTYEGTRPLCTSPGGFYSEVVQARMPG